MQQLKPVAAWLLSQFGSPANALAVVGALRRRLGDSSKDADTVLDFIRKYAHVMSTTAFIAPSDGKVDPVQMGINEGRRQVFLAIVDAFSLTEQDFKSIMEKPSDRRDFSRDKPASRWGADNPALDGSPGDAGGDTPSDAAGDAAGK